MHVRFYLAAVFALGLLLAAPTTLAAPAPSHAAAVAAVAPASFTPRYLVRVQNDADRYTRRLAYALGLTRRQEAIVYDLLVDRTLRATRRYGRQTVYPFPRRAAERTRPGRRFWNRTDDRIARLLTSRQRRAFYRLTHDRRAYFDDYDRRDDHYRDDRRRDRRRDRRGDRGWGG